LLGVWLFAIVVSVANACTVQGVHDAADDGMSMLHGHSGDDGAPPACERFCEHDTPLPTKVPSFDDASDGAGAIIFSNAPAIRVVARPDTLCDFNSVASQVVYPILLQSQRLAL
jgi:hypothetical protein